MSDNSNLLRVATMLPMDPRHRQLLTDSAAEIEALIAERDAMREDVTRMTETISAAMHAIINRGSADAWPILHAELMRCRSELREQTDE